MQGLGWRRKGPARNAIARWFGSSEFRLVDIARIAAVVEPEVAALGFTLVRVKLFAHSEVGGDEMTLQIMAEDPATGQLVLDQCAELSRRVSDRIDALEAEGEVLIADAYRLEVSSPGIDRPLTRPRDFADWAGHEARLELENPVAGNRKSLQGTLVGIEGESVTLDDKKSGRVSFALADIRSAKLVLTDRLIAATRPLDAGGAEFVEEEPDTEAAMLQQQED